ncbi:hypothetical protein COOONC_27180, partial [Cooperia oncophora]
MTVPEHLEDRAKVRIGQLMGGMAGFGGPSNFGALGPSRASGSQIGPEFGTNFAAPNVEDYEDNNVNGAATAKKPDNLVNIDDEDDFDEFTNPPTTAPTRPPNPPTLLPEALESNAGATTRGPVKEIRIELPQNVQEQRDSDYIDEVKTDGNSRIQVTSRIKNDGDESLLAPDRESGAKTLNAKLPSGVPNLPKLIKVLRRSNLKDSDIAEIISQIEDNENVPSPPRIDFSSAVQNIPLKKHQNRERIAKASREIQTNLGSPDQGHQLGQLPDLSVSATNVPPTTFQPLATPSLSGLHPHLLQPQLDPTASNRLQREIASVPTDKAIHRPAVSPTPELVPAQTQFTTPQNNLLFHHQHWPHPHYQTQYNAAQTNASISSLSFHSFTSSSPAPQQQQAFPFQLRNRLRSNSSSNSSTLNSNYSHIHFNRQLAPQQAT